MKNLTIDSRMLRKLLALYFAPRVIDESELKELIEDLERDGVSPMDIVESCESVLPSLATPENVISRIFGQSAAGNKLSQCEALRLVLKLNGKVSHDSNMTKARKVYPSSP
ncbi:MAG: hypothetical protein HY912_07630 [Desulfomonile tiedjei]|uniref:Uncharacterized protein n=1 Tax=Desulfomonile tiedjei TaxID=2358 RepID=A0A9D6V254_9BACT|nr:hypothetical protein [Desulfomonile tiedjei]